MPDIHYVQYSSHATLTSKLYIEQTLCNTLQYHTHCAFYPSTTIHYVYDVDEHILSSRVYILIDMTTIEFLSVGSVPVLFLGKNSIKKMIRAK